MNFIEFVLLSGTDIRESDRGDLPGASMKQK
jgi:hypothetical protein